jgi:hypothetical protein
VSACVPSMCFRRTLMKPSGVDASGCQTSSPSSLKMIRRFRWASALRSGVTRLAGKCREAAAKLVMPRRLRRRNCRRVDFMAVAPCTWIVFPAHPILLRRTRRFHLCDRGSCRFLAEPAFRPFDVGFDGCAADSTRHATPAATVMPPTGSSSGGSASYVTLGCRPCRSPIRRLDPFIAPPPT